MRSVTSRPGMASMLILVVLAELSAACTSEPSQPPPSPESTPYYAPVPRDLCARLRLAAVVAEFDLAVGPLHEPTGGHHTDERRTNTDCSLWTESVGTRFAAGEAPFQPAAVVDVYVYQDPAEAVHEYGLGVSALEYREDRLDARLAPADGWWDDGESGETVREVPDDHHKLDIGVASRIDVEYVIRHENLFIRARIDALTATEDVDDATAVLHDLIVALIDETAEHLALTTED